MRKACISLASEIVTHLLFEADLAHEVNDPSSTKVTMQISRSKVHPVCGWSPSLVPVGWTEL